MSQSAKGVLLVVEDDPNKRVNLRLELTDAGYRVLEAEDGPRALRILGVEPVHVVISNLSLPGMDGLQLLENLKAQHPQTHVIVTSPQGSVDTAIEAIKRGAYDYLPEPCPKERLLERLERLVTCQSINGQAPRPAVEELGSLVARSHAGRRLLDQIRKVAAGESSVLILGEAGSGTTSVAEEIHANSSRAAQPMVRLHCAAQSNQLEAQLLDGQNGALVRSRGGTLLIEEIDAMPMDVQVKLAAALDAPDGSAGAGHRPRLICISRKDLRESTEQGRFRQELYYRLSTAVITVPPLRDRREDIPLLAERLIKREAAKAAGHAGPRWINPHAIDLLMGHTWPGNIRELEQVLTRAVTFADGDQIEQKDILLPVGDSAAVPQSAVLPTGFKDLTETVAGVERTLINNALRKAAGNQAKAAQLLGIPRTTLRDKMAKYGMVGDGTRRPVASPPLSTP